MTDDIERDDFEDVLRRFRPAGPPADLRARVLASRPVPGRKFWTRRAVFAGGVAIAATAVAITIWSTREPANDDRNATDLSGKFTPGAQAEFVSAWSRQPRIDLGISADGAAVLVVEYVDWLCSPCEGPHRTIRTLTADYADRVPARVKHVVLDWPLDADCNAVVSTTVHPGACAAAAAVRIARSRGKGEAMEDWLFANRGRIATLDRSGAVAAIKVGAADVLGSLELNRDYDVQLARLRKDTASGRAFTPTATPTIFVNGVRLPGGVTPEYLTMAIRTELELADGVRGRPRRGDDLTPFGRYGGGGATSRGGRGR